MNVRVVSLIIFKRLVSFLLKRNAGILFLFFLVFFSSMSFGQAVGDYRSAGSGAWSTLATWQRLTALPSTWATPTAGQGYPGQFSIPGNVLIQSLGHSVTIDVSPLNNIGSLTVGGVGANPTLTFNSINDLTLKVTGNVTVADGTFTVANATGTNNHTLTIGGNLSVALGTTFSMNANVVNSDFCTVLFNGNNALQTVTGSGTISFDKVTVNKGILQSNILDVQSIITMTNGGLTLTNGTFKLSSASTLVPFTSDPGIPSTARLWNNGGTLNSTASFDWTFAGTVEASAGTINVGITTNDRLAPDLAGTGALVLSGGNVNVAGRISNSTAVWSFTMTSGTFKVPTVGTNVSTRSPFNMNNTGGSFSMSGGTIIIERSGGAAGENLGFRNIANGGSGFIGGALEIGDGVTPAGNIMHVETSHPVYNLTVNSANATAQLQSPPSPVTSLTVSNNVTISNGILDASFLDLTVGGNWTNASSITDPLIEGTKSVTFNGSGAQTITNTANANGTLFYNTIINNNFSTIPQLILAANTTVTNSLTMTNGVVNLAGFTVTLGKSATPSTLLCMPVSSTSWFYGGTFKRYWLSATPVTGTEGNFYGLFPVGSSTSSSYRPVEINSTVSPTTGGYFTVTHNNAIGTVDLIPFYDDAGTNITRIHNAQFITNYSGITGGTYDINVTMTGLLPGNISDIRLAIFTGGTTAGAVGIYTPATGTAQNPTAKRTGLSIGDLRNDFRIATIDPDVTPLPIHLINFSTERKENTVSCTWITAAEINNDYFIVQRSLDSKNTKDIGIVDGAGNSSSNNYYSFIDKSPEEGVSYYRLKQVDFDGRTSVSSWVPVTFLKNDRNLLIYPNPATTTVSCEFLSSEKGDVHVVITDVAGKIVFNEKKSIMNAQNKIDLDIASLADGFYFLSFSNENPYSNSPVRKAKFTKATN